MPNSLATCRLGLTVTRKAGGAVVRNRIKRRLREAFRRNRHELDRRPVDLVINGRAAVIERPREALERDLLQCFTRATQGTRR